MTVKELIAELEKQPPDFDVLLWDRETAAWSAEPYFDCCDIENLPKDKSIVLS